MNTKLLLSFTIVVLVVIVSYVLNYRPMNPKDFTDKTPKLIPEEYFSGTSVAHGVFFDRFGTLRTSFKVRLDGRWDGSVLLLDEDLTYADGTRSVRTFTITKKTNNLYEVSMPDLDGPGTIEVHGNCMRWRYRLKQDVGGGSVWVLSFDDWMFLQEDGVILNRAYASKWGIGLGEVQMSVQKQG